MNLFNMLFMYQTITCSLVYRLKDITQASILVDALITCSHTYIYIYICIHVYIHIHMYICISM